MATALLLSNLACQALVASPTPTDQLNFANAKPTRVPSPTPAPLSLRLTGEKLPDLEFGPPGKSPTERGRPQLSGPGLTLDTQHFRIHYTLSGDDAVPSKDGNQNQQPDYVEDIARALEFAWYAEIEHFGWPAPPSDGTIGGDNRFDIYLLNILPYNIAGFTDSDRESSLTGDNPNSPDIRELNSKHSFIVLDNDYAEYEDFQIPGITRLEYMGSTAAHEFNHAIQFGIDGEEPDTWLWEATATWMEDEVFNDVNETLRALPSEFKSTDLCQLSQGGDKQDEGAGHWYGMWIFMRYVSERFGDEAVRRIWELAAQQDGYAVLDTFLQEKNTNFEDFFTDFSLALLLRDFEEGKNYPTVRLEGQISASGTFTPKDGVQQIAVDYIEILGHGIFTVQLDNPDLVAFLVGMRDGQGLVYALGDNRATIDTRANEHTYLVVLNLNRAGSETICRYLDYKVSISPGTEETLEQPIFTKPAPHFEPPKVEDFPTAPELPGG